MSSFVTRRLDPGSRYGLRVSLFAVAAVVVGVPFGVLLQQVVSQGPVVRFDIGAAAAIHRLVVERPAVLRFMAAVSFLGKPVWLFVIVGAAALFLARQRLWRLVVFTVVTPLLGGIVDTAVKVAVNRDRPVFEQPLVHAMGKSFPSGHSMSAVVAYGALLVVFLPVLRRSHRLAAVIGVGALCFLIGISRLALGVHFLSDVVGGWALGVAWLAAAVAAFETWRADMGQRRTEPLKEGIEPESASELDITSA